MRFSTILFFFLLAGCSRHGQLAVRTLSQAEWAKLQIRSNDKLATPEWIQGKLLNLAKIKAENRADSLLAFMAVNPEIFKLHQPANELKVKSDRTDELGYQHLRFSRLHQNIPIWNDDLVIHINKKGEAYLVNGRYHASQEIVGQAVVSAEKAAAVALDAAKEKKLDRVDENEPVWYPAGAGLRLAHHLVLSGENKSWDYFVAADNGEILYDQDRRRFQMAR